MSTHMQDLNALQDSVDADQGYLLKEERATTCIFCASFVGRLHLHLSLNRESRWCTTGDFTTSFLLCSLLPSGPGELTACPLPDVVFPPLFLSALFVFFPSPCASQHGFSQT